MRAAFAVLLCICCAESSAALVTHTFSGTITNIATATTGSRPSLGSIDVGDTFTGSFTYDTLAAVDSHSDPNIGWHFYPGVVGAEATIDGLTFTTDPGVNQSGTDVYNNFNNGGSIIDAIQPFRYGLILPSGWSSTGDSLRFPFLDDTATALSDDDLPSVFDPSLFSSAFLELRFASVSFPGGSAANVLITGTIDAAPAAVPEPSSMALLGLVGGAGVVVTRLKRRGSKTLEEQGSTGQA